MATPEQLKVWLGDEAAADELYPELAQPVRAIIRSHAERFLCSRASA